MPYQFRSFQSGDFTEIRNFLVQFYQNYQLGNWTLDRLNFTYSVSRILNNTSVEDWQTKVGIWYRGEHICAVILSEGEQRGEAVMLLDAEPDEALLQDLFEFCDNHMSHLNNETGEQEIFLSVPNRPNAIDAWLARFGYQPAGWEEVDSYLSLHHQEAVQLAEGYSLLSGGQITPRAKAKAHAQTWGYYESADYNEARCTQAWAAMTNMPDYIPDLDLCAVTEDGEIAAFVTLWLDTKNELAILEPVGTVVCHQRKGLSKALIQEGCHRALKLGAKRVKVGSDIPAYLAMGFQPAQRYPIFRKNI